MTIDQLQIFLAVAQHMHFTRAAEALYITQPSVSAAIQSLEEQYGVKLFNRVGRRIELTLSGKMLQVEAQKILTQVELTERGLRELNDLKRGELKLGASQTIGNYWLPHFISLFKQKYPHIDVDCTLGNTTEISEGIVTGLFDLSLVEGEVEASVLASLELRIVGGDCLQIVVGQSHPWFEQVVVDVTELTNTAWVMREKGSGTRQQFEQVLRHWGIEATQLNVILSMKSGDMVKAAVESGVGAAAVSNLIIVKELRLDMLRRIKVTDVAKDTTDSDLLSRPFFLLKHRERFQTRVSQVFEQLLVSAQMQE
ncbi:MAG: LysR substrate-binding domain-containing protein [Rhizonema sp. PD38]|nr:LysR substrate-binding domain-containing protein [Rhizonema sp. PD38]